MLTRYLPPHNLSSSVSREDLLGFLGVSLLFTVAEGLIFARFGEYGLLVHGFGLITLFVLIQVREGPVVYLYQSLVLVPVLRVFNLGLPIFSGNSLVIIAVLYTFLLVSILLVTRSQKLDFESLGMSASATTLRMAALGILSGLGLGSIQYLLSLEQFDITLSLTNAVLLIVSVGLLVGLVEELIFRGLIQRWASDLFDTWTSIIVVSILFGFMHSVWLASLDIVFAGLISVYLGWVYARTNDMWFLVGTHSMINVSAFLIYPLLIPQYRGILDTFLGSLI